MCLDQCRRAAITTTPDSKSRGRSPDKGPEAERERRVGAECILHCWHPRSSLAAPSLGRSSQGPAASKLRTKGRGRRGHHSQKPASPMPPLMAAEPYVPRCQSALWWPWSPLPRATASAGAIPIPKINWHSGAQLQASACRGPVGGGLKPPLPPWVSHHSLTGELGDKNLPPRLPLSPGHRACLQTAPVVSRQPGPGPRGHCRCQRGPAEDGVSWQPGSTRDLGGGVWSSPWQEEANEHAGPFYSVGNLSGQGPSPLVLPLAGEAVFTAVHVPELHHVTVYSSSW